MEFTHIPVLLGESIDALAIKPDGNYADFTLGRAGHSLEIAKRLTTGRLFCIDRDAAAISAAQLKLNDYEKNVTLIKCDFRDATQKIREHGADKLDGILMDLGVSSPQIDDVSRGFSYSDASAPLDMRMDTDSPLSAYDIVNTYSSDELRTILTEYGEERYAALVAKRITERRPVNTTSELVNIIKSAIPAKALREKQHPAMRTFQAIRIAVNDELGALESALLDAESILGTGGRLCVISFHSLEDRIVKQFISKRVNGCTCPSDFPLCVCGFKPSFKQISGKPITPSPQETANNPRSKSAKLRVAEKL